MYTIAVTSAPFLFGLLFGFSLSQTLKFVRLRDWENAIAWAIPCAISLVYALAVAIPAAYILWRGG